MTAPATLAVEDGIAHLTLDRPEQRNALSEDMTAAIREHVATVRHRDDVRALVVSGSGGAFSAGGDIGWMEEVLESETPLHDRSRDLQATTHRTMADVYNLPVPTIATIDGPAVGAGAALALACDLQVMSDRSVMGFVFRNVGLAVDSGTSFLLPRVVGTNTAKELVMTGAMLDAEDAADLGLVNRVVPEGEFEDAAATFVDDIASGPTVALATSARLVDEAFEKSFEQALQDEATAQGAVFDTADHVEGVEAFAERRDPEFEGQ